MADTNVLRTSIELRNQRGKLVKIFNKEITGANWNYDRIGGCGAFRVGLKSLYDEHPVVSWGDHDLRIYLGPADGSTLVLWYRGYVDRASGRLSGDETVDVTGYGYIRQLERVILNNKNYLNKEVSSIVTDILDNFILPNTDVTYLAADVQSTGIVAQSIIFNTSADQAIKTLSDLVGSREWGVDKNLRFYFKARVNYAKVFVFIKRDIEGFDDIRSFDEIKNSYYLQGKSGFTYALEHAESITLYGKRQAILVNSSITNATDANQYLTAILNESSKPRRQMRCRIVSVNAPYENDLPLGRVSMMAEDLQGTLYGEKKYGEFLYGFQYQSQINTIGYTLRTPGENIVGVEAVIQAAYLPPQIGKSIKQIEQELEEVRNA